MLLVSNENETKYQHLGGRKELRYEHTSFAIKGKPHPNTEYSCYTGENWP